MKVDSTTLLLAGAAAVAVYFITRPKTVTTQMPVYNPYAQPAYNPYAQQPGGSSTAQDIAAGGTAAASILDAISQFSNSNA
jgi:hypothetical protein